MFIIIIIICVDVFVLLVVVAVRLLYAAGALSGQFDECTLSEHTEEVISKKKPRTQE